MRSKILSKLIFASCVRYSDRAYIYSPCTTICPIFPQHPGAFFSGWRMFFRNPKTPANALSPGADRHEEFFFFFFVVSLFLIKWINLSPFQQVLLFADSEYLNGFEQISEFAVSVFFFFSNIQIKGDIDKKLDFGANLFPF